MLSWIATGENRMVTNSTFRSMTFDLHVCTTLEPDARMFYKYSHIVVLYCMRTWSHFDFSCWSHRSTEPEHRPVLKRGARLRAPSCFASPPLRGGHGSPTQPTLHGRLVEDAAFGEPKGVAVGSISLEAVIPLTTVFCVPNILVCCGRHKLRENHSSSTFHAELGPCDSSSS